METPMEGDYKGQAGLLKRFTSDQLLSLSSYSLFVIVILLWISIRRNISDRCGEAWDAACNVLGRSAYAGWSSDYCVVIDSSVRYRC